MAFPKLWLNPVIRDVVVSRAETISQSTEKQSETILVIVKKCYNFKFQASQRLQLLFVIIVNWIPFTFCSLDQKEQAILRRHLGLWEDRIGIFSLEDQTINQALIDKENNG